MKRLLFLSVLSLFLFSSCKKKTIPASVMGSPVFHFNGRIANDTVSLQAGVSHLYMYTGFYKDDQSLMTIKSYFAPDNCTACEPYLSFEVKDFDVTNTNGLAGTLADLIHGGGTFDSYSLDSVLNTSVIESFQFYPYWTTVGTTYHWDFGDGTQSTAASPVHSFTGGGLRQVNLTVNSGGVIDSLSNAIATDFHSGCRAQFTTQYDSTHTGVYVSASPSGFTYAWNFGDGNTGVGANDTNVYNTPGSYIITLNASSPSCSTQYRNHVQAGAPPFKAVANYTFTTFDTTLTTFLPRLNKSAFIITWIKNGVTYKSFKNLKGINQSGNPVFTFVGFSNYVNNEKGEKTIKIWGTVDTYLYNYANWQDSIHIRSNDLVLAAAYPN